ncbi:MAG: Internalin-A [Chlamydiae bacterium]|nr:Internalin-A [Chlamydiota bacterium]
MTNPVNNNNQGSKYFSQVEAKQVESFSKKRKATESCELHQSKVSKTEYFKLDEFPIELTIQILKELNVRELINISYLNKDWHEFSNCDLVWKEIAIKIDSPFETGAEAKTIKQQAKDYIEDLKIKTRNIQKHSLAPKDIKDILSKNLIIENGILLNQFANSWSKFIIFCILANEIGDSDALERLNGVNTSGEIINLAKDFSVWFEKNKNELTQLQELDLSENEITSIPSEIWQLTQLRTLRLYGNQLISIPPEIGQLPLLKVFGLSGNQITTIPSEIGQLPQLRALDLSYNQLTIIPTEIGEWTTLLELDLSGNQIAAIPSEIGQLTLLENLDLSHNQLTTIPSEIGQLTLLEILDLYDNQLTTIPSEIGQLPQLRGLFLSDNQIETIQRDIDDWSQLKKHALSDNQRRIIEKEITLLSRLFDT